MVQIKRILLMATAIAVIAVLSACSSGGATNSSSSSAASDESGSSSAAVSTTTQQSSSGASSSAASAKTNVDDFTIVNVARGEDNSYGYWEMSVTVQNNTDEPKNFLGFQIDELNESGNIIDSYMSYNKNSSPTIVEPGQQYTITLTEKSDDGIAGMQSRYCEWGEFSKPVKSEYSEKFKIMF